jgi:hypothetical protein
MTYNAQFGGLTILYMKTPNKSKNKNTGGDNLTPNKNSSAKNIAANK